MRHAVTLTSTIFFDADDDDTRVKALIDAAQQHIGVTGRIAQANFGVAAVANTVNHLTGPDAKQLEHQQQCPFCGSSDIEGQHFEGEGHEAWQKVSCNECGEQWQEIYHRMGTDVTMAGDVPYPRSSTPTAP